MATIIPFTVSLRATSSRRALDRLTSTYARSHPTHVSPMVGCYLCLHSVPRRRQELAAAA